MKLFHGTSSLRMRGISYSDGLNDNDHFNVSTSSELAPAISFARNAAEMDADYKRNPLDITPRPILLTLDSDLLERDNYVLGQFVDSINGVANYGDPDAYAWEKEVAVKDCVDNLHRYLIAVEEVFGKHDNPDGEVRRIGYSWQKFDLKTGRVLPDQIETLWPELAETAIEPGI